ncbi:GNAT family N-acetyltransferase [Actinoplanes sp. NEAU-A12]|uniref:GNAT family N-acetyltransferase n=1 Tax=Actinoplanes sandaracinus TaxID=3045177 RepID=A0ABT6X094_9ACTN|nr:GNAT family N-acetyltransferase [Actinoplanes sandaracinus]MDI6105417.1 GNAT family N-acetyltransferase [Actinoplanes sandaracinus]
MNGIRQFQWPDYDAVAEVWQAAGVDVVTRAELEAKLTRDPELFLVAEAGDRITGVVMGTFDGRRGWIFRLGVHGGHRRQGIATRLVAELERRLHALGCPRINLLVLPGNEAGLRFWQHLGYLPCPDVLCTKPLPGPGSSTGQPAPASS